MRPEQPAHVGLVAEDSGLQAVADGKRFQRLHRAALPLDEKRHRACGGRHGEERDLFAEKRPPRGGSQCGRDSAERPQVEEQQHAGKRHHHRLRHQSGGKQAHDRKIATGARAPRVRGVGQQGRRPEKGAQHVFAFGDPGDRLDVHGMGGEQGSHDCARPSRTGQRDEQHEQQQAVQDVEREVGQMVRAGLEAEELDVRHVRDPREGVPVAFLSRPEGPGDVVRGEAGRDVPVFSHVLRVVESDERMLPHGRVDQQVEGDERHARPEEPCARRPRAGLVHVRADGPGGGGRGVPPVRRCHYPAGAFA